MTNSEWIRKQLFPRWKKTNSNTWQTTAWNCQVAVYWRRSKDAASYRVNGREYHALPGYTLRELKNRAVAMAQTTYRSTVAE
jgi:hypothetical protein